MRSLVATTRLLLAIVTLAASSPLDAADLLVGKGRADVTPKEPVPMWGYGARHASLSEGTLDPLFASTVVIQAGSGKLAIVGLDLGRSPAEASLQRIRDRIRDEAGIEHSFIAGSHTHHGPVLELTDRRGRGKGRFDAAIRYNQELEDGIVESILQANRELTPAKLAVGSTELVDFNRNRHSKLQPAPIDPTLSVMRFDRASDDTPIALLVNFTAHPTSIPAETLKFSSDYVAGIRQAVEEERGGIAVFMQGASGDISTNRGPHGDHIAYGQALGREAVKLASSLTPVPIPSPSLKVREERFVFQSRTDFRNPLILGAYGLAFFPELVGNFADEYEEGIRPRLTVALLNQEIAIVGGSGEFFCQHANRLRERSRTKHLFFFGYSNGYHQYFPTIEGAAEGGYGADAQVATAEVGAGETMMNTALKWLYQMRGKIE